MHRDANRLTALAALVLGVGLATAQPAAAGDDGGGGNGGGKRCVAEQEARLHAAGGDGGPPEFSAEFYEHAFTLETSLDGVERNEIPMSIEKVCDVPRSLRKEAAQLAGAEGLGRLRPRTEVWKGGRLLEGDEAMRALDGADTADIRARLVARDSWGEDEDGEPVATFRARRIKITD